MTNYTAIILTNNDTYIENLNLKNSTCNRTECEGSMKFDNSSNFKLNNSVFELNTAYLGGGLIVLRPEYG